MSFPENLSKQSLSETSSLTSKGTLLPENLTYQKFIGRRASIAEAVAERKKAEVMQLEFEDVRLDKIDSAIADNQRSEIFYLIFSPINAKRFRQDENVGKHYHIITDNINLDIGIWKLVADGKWDILKKLHRPALDEFCPAKFKDKLALFWEII